MRGVWIEIVSLDAASPIAKSLPMRGVWIEIVVRNDVKQPCQVTPHAGSVD